MAVLGRTSGGAEEHHLGDPDGLDPWAVNRGNIDRHVGTTSSDLNPLGFARAEILAAPPV